MAEAYKIRQKDHQSCTYVYYIYIYLFIYMHTHTHHSLWADGRKEDEVGRCFLSLSIYRMSQEECARLREGVPYVKVYRYNTKHLCQS